MASPEVVGTWGHGSAAKEAWALPGIKACTITICISPCGHPYEGTPGFAHVRGESTRLNRVGPYIHHTRLNESSTAVHKLTYLDSDQSCTRGPGSH